MATYAFETITAAEAQAIKAGDILTFTGPARAVAVSYTPLGLTLPAQILLTANGRTVAFGTELSELSIRGAIRSADGSKLFVGDFAANVAIGGELDDGLYGGAGDDTLLGRDGNDFIHGNGGDDSLQGGEGRDTVYGGQGEDYITLGLDSDSVSGGYAHGNLGDDIIITGAGADTLLGGQGHDFLAGGENHDVLFGDLGNDVLRGEGGDDEIYGGAGEDRLISGGGYDILSGGAGDDILVIERAGHVIADGGEGDDLFTVAGQGPDILRGGAGRDRFEFVAGDRPAQGQDDAIRDWNGAEDRLHFDQFSIYAADASRYGELIANGYADALARANALLVQGKAWVAAAVGTDVIVFAETNGSTADGADVAVVLTGVGLADIDWTNVY